MRQPPHIERDELEAFLRDIDLFTPTVSAALDLAISVHGRQQRYGGAPYLEEHVFPVTRDVIGYLVDRQFPDLETAAAAALLHDVVEDSTDVTEPQLSKQFGSRVAAWVVTLSKPAERNDGNPERETEEDYLAGIAVSPFPVRAIKVFDRLNNLAGLHLRSRRDQEHYLEETRARFLNLASGVDPELRARMEALVAAQEPEGAR
jgi:(p)ppGpp synthase/HD superfamily hydrolase